MSARPPHHNAAPISDELINAFIDRQITAEERQEILSGIRYDKDLAGRICDLQQIKEMTRSAFDNIPQPPPRKRRNFGLWPRKAVAFALFAVGLLIGLGGMEIAQTRGSQALAVSHNDDVTKVLVHLTSNDVDGALNTLNNLQQLLDTYAQKHQHVLVEVVANGNGIQLLNDKNTFIARRIHALIRQHKNLTFAACKNTIDQIRLTKGLRFKLIPGVKLIDSGVVKVIERQKQGWTYIRG